MAKLLKLTIARVDGSVFDGDVVSVNVPGSEGDMTILADHAPLVSALKAGTITVATEASTETFEVTRGTLEIHNNHATVLI